VAVAGSVDGSVAAAVGIGWLSFTPIVLVPALP
jgi:uncharacterized membrane protein YbjE (DUF340 family)